VIQATHKHLTNSLWSLIAFRRALLKGKELNFGEKITVFDNHLVDNSRLVVEFPPDPVTVLSGDSGN